jgi:hypothetical protein
MELDDDDDDEDEAMEELELQELLVEGKFIPCLILIYEISWGRCVWDGFGSR